VFHSGGLLSDMSVADNIGITPYSIGHKTGSLKLPRAWKDCLTGQSLPQATTPRPLLSHELSRRHGQRVVVARALCGKAAHRSDWTMPVARLIPF